MTICAAWIQHGIRGSNHALPSVEQTLFIVCSMLW